MSYFVMPSLGSDMERATLIECLVEPGAEVKRGDLIAVVETDKGAIEIEVFEDGYLRRWLVELDTEVLVGEPLAEIESAAGRAAATTDQPVPAQQPVQVAEPAPVQAPQVLMPRPPPGLAGQRISPAARQLAAQHGLDPSGLAGTGPQGAVVYRDVLTAVAGVAEPAARPARDTGPDRMRQAIAAAMARSKREIPHYYLSTTADLETATSWLSDVNADKAPRERLLAVAMFIKATALALRKFPEFNGFYEEGSYRPSERINVGVAIAIRGGGLVAPAIHDTDQLALEELMVRLKDLSERVRAGRYRASELRDPTVTVTSLGDRGVESVYGVIYPPQVACIGFGKVVDAPWSMPDRSVVSRRTVSITLAADHRVSDGRRGGVFMNAIAGFLGDPQML